MKLYLSSTVDCSAIALSHSLTAAFTGSVILSGEPRLHRIVSPPKTAAELEIEVEGDVNAFKVTLLDADQGITWYSVPVAELQRLAVRIAPSPANP
jgi:hypothetical protein